MRTRLQLCGMRGLLCAAVLACGPRDAPEQDTDAEDGEEEEEDGPDNDGDTTVAMETTGTTGDTGFPDGRVPWRDEWRIVIDQPFSSSSVTRLELGGLEEQDNFANRGDIIVRYAPENRILVEMRRFTIAQTQAAAEQDFASLKIWTSWANGAPKPPHEMNPVESCRDPSQLAPWPDDCKVRVYFEGPLQPAVTGADLRVTLPSDYVGDLEIVTEDSDVHANYHNRGNVCIENLPGVADVDLADGVAYMILAPDIKVMPRCPGIDYELCRTYDWDPGQCPCLFGNQPYPFGFSRMRSRQGAAAEMVIDMPENFWAALSLLNEGEQQETVPDTNVCVNEPGLCCDAIVDDSVGEFVMDASIGDPETRDPWRNAGWANYPGFPALNGAGYFLQLLSSECGVVTTAENPGEAQQETERGNLTICAGCLRAQTCDDLLP